MGNDTETSGTLISDYVDLVFVAIDQRIGVTLANEALIPQYRADLPPAVITPMLDTLALNAMFHVLFHDGTSEGPNFLEEFRPFHDEIKDVPETLDPVRTAELILCAMMKSNPEDCLGVPVGWLESDKFDEFVDRLHDGINLYVLSLIRHGKV